MTTMVIDTVVDDIELLAILGISPKIAVLDWDDMPELDDDLDDDDKESTTTQDCKRKYSDEEENVFNQFDFIEVSTVVNEEKEPESKKRKLSFVENEDFLIGLNEFKMNLVDERDIQLALELTSL